MSLSILIKAFWVMTSYQFVHSFRRYEYPASICKVVQKVKLSIRIEKLVIKSSIIQNIYIYTHIHIQSINTTT